MAKIGIIADINQHHTRRWVHHFSARNQVILISPKEIAEKNKTKCTDYLNQHQKSSNFKSIFIPVIKKNLISWLNFIVKLKRLIRQEKIELLYVHGINLPSFLATFVKNTAFVLCPWGSDILIFPKKSFFFRLMAKKIVARASKIAAISAVISEASQQLGSDKEKIKLIPMGTDMNYFKPGLDTDYLKKRFKLPAEAQVVLSLRNFTPLYNIDTIIKSIPLVAKQVPGVKYLLLAGHGGQKSYAEAIDQLIADLDVASYIVKIDYLEEADMPKIYNLADAIISVPSSDAFGCSLHEAMACKTALIVSDLPAMKDLLQHDLNACIVPIKNHERLAEATIALLKDQKMRQRFVDYNYNLVKEKANAEKNVKQLEIIFDALIK